MGLPGCLFVCHLILLLMCFLFNCIPLVLHTVLFEAIVHLQLAELLADQSRFEPSFGVVGSTS